LERKSQTRSSTRFRKTYLFTTRLVHPALGSAPKNMGPHWARI